MEEEKELLGPISRSLEVYVKPAQAIKLINQNRDQIEEVEIVPPKLGSKSLGGLRIKMEVPPKVLYNDPKPVEHNENFSLKRKLGSKTKYGFKMPRAWRWLVK